jgi:hypothetical protein
MANSKQIDVTPTWQDITPVLIAVLQNPDASKESQDEAYAQVMKLAWIADKLIEQKKSQAEAEGKSLEDMELF